VANTPLAGIIADIIRREGPIGIDRYWDLALFHREHGYYASREPFGAGGDFVTAPDVSQMFGELIAAWLVAAWHGLDRPSPFVLAEIGPGRGTLMADILRTVRKLDIDFLKAAKVALVETSERLQRVQAERLESFDLPIRHVRRLADVEALPLLLVANELFDAVAIRQFVRGDGVWHEIVVELTGDDALGFALRRAPDGIERTFPPTLPEAEPGTTLEISPQRDAIADSIAARIAAHGGAAVMIDYGHGASGYGNTLQAMRDHAFADPLDAPGEVDVTSHVDFEALALRFAVAGVSVAPIVGQGDFLIGLGLGERASQLGRGRGEVEQAAIMAAAHRLCGLGEDEMGGLFKVLAVASKPLPLPPFTR
jgi:SAM-dependent MidA family methyltransferase